MTLTNLTVLALAGSAVSEVMAGDLEKLGMMVKQLDDEIMVEWLWCWNRVGEMVKFQEGVCDYRRAQKSEAGVTLE